MSIIRKFITVFALSNLLCFCISLCIYANDNSIIINPKAAYTKNITYQSECYLNGNYSLTTVFSVTADDTTGIINSVQFKSWSLSPSYGGYVTINCTLNSLTKVNNYRYTAILNISVFNNFTNSHVATDTVTIIINSPGTRSV